MAIPRVTVYVALGAWSLVAAGLATRLITGALAPGRLHPPQ
jgi:hypothetical protein